MTTAYRLYRFRPSVVYVPRLKHCLEFFHFSEQTSNRQIRHITATPSPLIQFLSKALKPSMSILSLLITPVSRAKSKLKIPDNRCLLLE